VNLAMTVFTRRQLNARRSLHAEFAMDADGLDLDYVVVTGSTVHRIQPAPVSARVGADVAVEALCDAMNGGLKLCQVSFVAI
jgi:hypothetical protein